MTFDELDQIVRSNWPGMNLRSVQVNAEMIDVTTFGDAAQRFVPGRKFYNLALTCDEQAMRRLFAILRDPELPSQVQPAVDMPIIEPGQRAVQLPEE